VVTALAAISAGLFAAAVLSVFASLLWMRLKKVFRSCKSASASKGEPEAEPSADAEAGIQEKLVCAPSIAVIQVEGMTCTACSGAVERALLAVEGVEFAEVNLITHSARVQFASPLETKVLCDTIEDIGFGASMQSCEAAEKTSQEMSSVATLSIDGMFCTNCSSAVERALNGISGVDKAVVNLLSHSAVVTFRPPVKDSDLSSAVEDIGFGASVQSVVAEVEEEDFKGKSSAERFKASLPSKQNACMLRLAFPAASNLKIAHEQLAQRKGVAGVVVKPRARELRVSYWSQEVGARILLEELKEQGARWGGDSRHSDDGHLLRAERALRIRYLLSVPPTAAIFTIAFIIPNVFPERMGSLNDSVCCGGAVSWQTLLLILLATPVQFGIGAPMHRSALRALRSGHLSMDVLVSLGTMLAYFYSIAVTLVWAIVGSELPQALVAADSHHGHDGHKGSVAPPPHFFEASAMLLSILMLGKCIESHAKRKTGDCLHELASRWPSEARLASSTEKVPCDLLQIDDMVAITMGETLPCDGFIVQGGIHVDESVLTGEDSPVRKDIGDFVVGGSKCLEGAAQFKASAVGSNTAMSQVQAMVAAAQSAKPDIARVANKVAAVFVPVILALSLLTFSVWAVIVATGAVEVPSSLSDPDGAQQAEARLAERSFFISRFALALMMMACPCAFGLAAPTAILVATGVAARRGCLIKTGRALEMAEHLKAVVLDKTGTVTVGKPMVTRVAVSPAQPSGLAKLPQGLRLKASAAETASSTVAEWLPTGNPSPASAEASKTKAPPELEQTVALWAAVGAVEAPSQHPLAKSLASHAKALLESVPEAEDWKSVTGLGVEGRVPGLGWVRVGRLKWVTTGKGPKRCACPEVCRCTAENSCGCQCWMEKEKKSKAEDNSPLLKKTVDWDAPLDSGGECGCADSCGCTEEQGCGCTCWKMRPKPAQEKSPNLVEDWIASMGAQGAGVVAVSIDDQLLGAVVMRDVLQPGAPAAVKALQDRGIQVWLCSGDQKTTTRAVAAEIGITHWIGEAMPQDKSRLVEELRARAPVGFVGDGVNDAPALAAATLGVAIGAGAHVTVDAADVVLVRSAFEDFIGFVHLARRALRTIRMNYFWAFGFNILGLPLAAGVLYPNVHLPPVVAGSAMAGSSLLVVFNSLRLRSAGSVWGRRPAPASHGAIEQPVQANTLLNRAANHDAKDAEKRDAALEVMKEEKDAKAECHQISPVGLTSI